MKSQTSLIASQCRLQQWAKQIRDCQNRPADMQVSEWSIGATAPSAMTANGVDQSPAGKRKSVRAKSPVPLPPTGAAFILNLIGIFVFIPQSREEQKNTERLIITAQVQNG